MRAIVEVNGQRVPIEVPQHLSEIRFVQFCEFREKEQAFWKENEREEGTEVDQESEAMIYLKLEEAIKVFSGEGIEEVPVSLEGDNFQAMIDSGYRLKIGDEVTLLRYYAHIVTLINGYKPEKIPTTFEWKSEKGKTYKIKSVDAARAIFGTAMTAGEAITVLEYQRRAGLSERMGLTGIGNIEFSLGLTELAILLRRPGEKLPADKRKRDQFIEQRREVFADVTLDVIMSLRFFLLNSLLSYATTRNTNFSGRARLTQDGARLRIVKGKPRNGHS